jgi:nucleotide-binding universal stress UspA family protein
MYRHVLVAVDGSDCSNYAASQGVRLCEALQARLTFITVTPDWKSIGLSELALGHLEDEYPKRAEAYATRILQQAKQAAASRGLDVELVHKIHRKPHKAILEEAESRGCDLIVVGSHGRHGVERLLLGSEASKVTNLSPISVLVVRGSANA